MLGLRPAEPTSLLTFEYDCADDASRAASRAALQPDSTLRLRMSSVRVTYWHAAAMRTVEYLQGGVLGAIVSAASSTVAYVARSVLALDDHENDSALGLDVSIGSPLVLIPLRAGCTPVLRADLGAIGVTNTIVRRAADADSSMTSDDAIGSALLDRISISVERMRLSSAGRGEGAGEDGGGGGGAPMIEEVSLAVTVERGLGIAACLPTIISGVGSELEMACSKEQYDVFSAFLSDNLAGGADPLVQHALRAIEAAHLGSETESDYESDDGAASVGGAVSGPGPSTAPLRRRIELRFRRATLRLSDAGGPLLSAAIGDFALDIGMHERDEMHISATCQTIDIANGRMAPAPASANAAPRGLERLLWAGGTADGAPPQLRFVYVSEPSQKTVVVALSRTQVAAWGASCLAMSDRALI